MIDYHLHLWPHTERDSSLAVEHLIQYFEKAAESGITEIAVTEHLFRFKQADWLLSKWWNSQDDPMYLRHSMENYWYFHIGADLDKYVETVLKAKAINSSIKLGLEVDFYPGQMDRVSKLLSDYPFDVLLGSVHWIKTWRFDDLDDPISMKEWNLRDAKKAWQDYLNSFEELVRCGCVDVVAHPDLIKVTGVFPDEGFKKEFEDSVVSVIHNYKTVTELSSAGFRKPIKEQYPSVSILKQLAQKDTKFTLASDAHSLKDVGDQISDLAKLLSSFGIDKLASFEKRTVNEISLYDTK